MEDFGSRLLFGSDTMVLGRKSFYDTWALVSIAFLLSWYFLVGDIFLLSTFARGLVYYLRIITLLDFTCIVLWFLVFWFGVSEELDPELVINTTLHGCLMEGCSQWKEDMFASYYDSSIRIVYWTDVVSALDLNSSTAFPSLHSIGFTYLETSQVQVCGIQRSSHLPLQHTRCPRGSLLPPPIRLSERSSCLPLQHTRCPRGSKCPPPLISSFWTSS